MAAAAEVRAKILRYCANGYKTPSQIAEAVGLSQNTVRAYYLYKMHNEGLLERRYENQTSAQAYKKV